MHRYGTSDKDDLWYSKLKHLTPFDIKNGLEKMEAPGTPYKDYPPTPLAFRDLCKPPEAPKPSGDFYVASEPIPHTEKKQEIADRELDKMFSMLGVKRKDGNSKNM